MPTDVLALPTYTARGDHEASRDNDVVVIGAGITGLTVAWELSRLGIDVTVLEASNRAGGVIATDRQSGWTVERGPTSMSATPAVLRLFADVGLEADVIPVQPAARQRYIAVGSRLLPVPLTPLAVARTPLLSTRAKLRLLREPFTGRGSDPNETVAAFTRRRFGDEPLRHLVAPFVSGIFAGDADSLSVRHAMPSLHALEQTHGSLVAGAIRSRLAARRSRNAPRAHARPVSLEGGLGQLTGALSDALEGRVWYGERVERMAPDTGGWRLECRDADGRHRERIARHVVVTTPSHALPEMDVARRHQTCIATIAAIPHTPVATVSIGVRRRDVRHALDGFGFLVAEGERRSLLGALFTSTMFAGRCPNDHVLLTCFVGGAKAPWRVGRRLGETVDAIMTDLRELLGVSGEPVFVARSSFDKAIPQYGTMHDRVTDAASSLESAYTGLALAGSWRSGVSVGQCVSAAYTAARRVAVLAGVAQ